MLASTAARSPASKPALVADHRGEQVVRDPAAGDGGGADDLAGALVEPVEPHQQQVGQVGRQHPAAVPGGGDELLGEERVALGPGDDPADLHVGDRVGVQLVHQPADLLVRQRLQA